MTDSYDFSTRAIRTGQEFDPSTGSVIPPIYQTSTFVQDGIGGFRGGYEYARGGNPTRTSLETLIADLEGGKHGFSFASGLAAEDTLLRALLVPGDHVVMGNDVYGGTHRLVDNTFASPYLQNPIAFGADVVTHSTTKYLGGHSDVLGGALVMDDDELAQKVRFLQFAVGAVSGPMDAWLTVRGIKTLAVRVDRHTSNAQAIAEALVGHPAIERVYYPGLPEHPGHDVAARQMRGFGGMLSVGLRGGAAAARRFAESTELFQLAESLGGVESLIGYPSEMTHASVRGTKLEVPDNIVRLSVGIEGEADLIADVLGALDRGTR